MNEQHINVKSLFLTFLLYIVSTVVMAVLLSLYWQSGIDTALYTQQQLVEMASTSPLINIGSTLIGSGMAVICAYLITSRTGSNSYKHAVYFAGSLILYGIISIVLHPEHEVMQQVAKIVAPVPLCLLGAWLANVSLKTNTSQRRAV